MHKKRRGFTLIELIMVIVIMITIAAIAIPNYGKAKRRTMQKEGISNVKLIAAAETAYKIELDGYAACSCTNATDCRNETTGCNAILKLMLNTANWTYTVVTPTSASATITATASSIGCTYTLTSASFDSEPTGSGCS